MLFKITLAVAVFLLQSSIGYACTCAPRSSVLDEYERSPVVAIARVASLDKAAKDDRRHNYGVQSARLVVEKIYKGDVRVGDELVFAQGDGVNCLMRFSEENIGDRLLLYVGVPQAGTLLAVTFCGRSSALERATEDLLYLDKLDQVRGKTRVSGKYAGGFYGRELSVAGKKIRLVSEGDTYETTTDENGVFEIYDLPPGNYRLEPELQTGLTIDFAWVRLSGGLNRDQPSETSVAFILKPQSHVSIHLGFKSKDQKWGGESRPE